MEGNKIGDDAVGREMGLSLTWQGGGRVVRLGWDEGKFPGLKILVRETWELSWIAIL